MCISQYWQENSFGRNVYWTEGWPLCDVEMIAIAMNGQILIFYFDHLSSKSFVTKSKCKNEVNDERR